MADKKTELIQNMVAASTEFGVFIVQEMAAQALVQKPDMSLKEFMQLVEHQLISIKDRILVSPPPAQ